MSSATIRRRSGPGTWALFGGARLGLWFILLLLALGEVSARSGLVVSVNWPPVSAIAVAIVRGLMDWKLLMALGCLAASGRPRALAVSGSVSGKLQPDAAQKVSCSNLVICNV